MTGRLTVVGVGPGDPELLTLKAVRALAEADVVAYPTTSRGSFAARIAAAHLAGKTHLPYPLPMTADGAAEPAYDTAAAAIAVHLEAGRHVALLCEGDPMLYGSAASLLQRLSAWPATIVPGITAASAAAAEAKVSLARDDAPLTILPATAPPAALKGALAGPGGVVIYKVGRHFDRVAAHVRASGRAATLAVRATLPEQDLLPLNAATAGEKPYFSAILSPPRATAAHRTTRQAHLPSAGLHEAGPVGADANTSPAQAGGGSIAPSLFDTSAPTTADRPVAILVLGPAALPAARRAKDGLIAAGWRADLHGLAHRLAPEEVDRLFPAVAHHVAALHRAGSAIVGVFSTGILVRAVAPALEDKPSDPPLLALAEDGSAVVPLLGAHRGGMAIAAHLAATFGVTPAVTTRSELVAGTALDDPPEGYTVADPRPFKPLVATLAPLAAAAPLRADQPSPATRPPSIRTLAKPASDVPPTARAATLASAAPVAAHPAVPPEAALLAPPAAHTRPAPIVEASTPAAAPLPAPTAAEPAPIPPGIRATTRALPDAATVPTWIARRLALGMGAERGADPAAAIALAHATLAAEGLDPRAVAVVASLDLKADEPALHAVANALKAPFRVFPREALAEQEPRLATPSEAVRAAVGIAGVAEAAAFAAAGPGSQLIAPKRVGERVTVAIAEAPAPIRPGGRPRGALAVVGIGPGNPRWRTAECVAALATADAFVGYSLYLDLVEDLRAHQTRHDFALGDEEARTRFALELAGTGRTVALISSGDPGVYAMATLAAELLDSPTLGDAARRVALTIVPGVSAALAAAARCGAPLGHDFALVSLSDLLTPWEAIRRRLRAVAEADFAVALYNPRSRRRTDQLGEALAIFRAARPADTPAVIAASVGRPAETIRHDTLATLDPASVDMLATVLVGASTTRRFTRGDGTTVVFTPRGYRVP